MDNIWEIQVRTKTSFEPAEIQILEDGWMESKTVGDWKDYIPLMRTTSDLVARSNYPNWNWPFNVIFIVLKVLP